MLLMDLYFLLFENQLSIHCTLSYSTKNLASKFTTLKSKVKLLSNFTEGFEENPPLKIKDSQA